MCQFRRLNGLLGSLGLFGGGVHLMDFGVVHHVVAKRLVGRGLELTCFLSLGFEHCAALVYIFRKY